MRPDMYALSPAVNTVPGIRSSNRAVPSAPRDPHTPISPAPTSVPVKPVSGLLNPGEGAAEAGAIADTDEDGESGAEGPPHEADAAIRTKTPAEIGILWNIECHSRARRHLLPSRARKQTSMSSREERPYE